MIAKTNEVDNKIGVWLMDTLFESYPVYPMWCQLFYLFTSPM